MPPPTMPAPTPVAMGRLVRMMLFVPASPGGVRHPLFPVTATRVLLVLLMQAKPAVQRAGIVPAGGNIKPVQGQGALIRGVGRDTMRRKTP